MPTKRTRRTRYRRFGALPDHVAWWLQHGRMADNEELTRFDQPTLAFFTFCGLCDDLAPDQVATSAWTRARLRQAGYDAEVDAVEARERRNARH